MSASNKKNKAVVYKTERQRQEAQEQKKLKIYTLSFWVVMALCVCIVLATVVTNPIKNVIYKNTDAITIGNHTLTSVDVNYFYIDAINNYTSQYSSYISYILDTSAPLSSQVVSSTTGQTWADYFLDMAKENMKSTYAVYDAAVAAGFQLDETEQKSIDSMMSTLELYATFYGYSNIDAYLRGVYGNGADSESYRNYYEICAIADAYYAEYYEGLEYEDEDLRKHEADKFYEFSSFTFSYYYINAVNLREGGTKGADGKTTYSDEEIKAAEEKALKIANELAAGSYADLDAFDAAIKALEINKDSETAAATRMDDLLYSSVNSLFRDWLVGKETKSDDSEEADKEETLTERKEGDITVIVNESGSGDSKTINGYYVVRYGSVNINDYFLKNVRHLLVKFEGGKTDSTTGVTTYTDAEKEKAKLEAEKLLADWVAAGELSEESFADLAEEHSDDNADEGGLYEDIYPGQMVEAFEDWCYDAERKAGDYGIVETEYGYHLMFFVGDSETTYRDYMVTLDIKSEDIENWHTGLTEAIAYTELTLKHVNKDLILGH